MKFKALRENLCQRLWKDMKNGGLTGMGLARETGLGQAHISNFLNGKRGLSLEAMDRILAARHISVLDLLDAAEINGRASIPQHSDTGFQNIPLVEERVAASAPRITRSMALEILKFPNSFLRRLRPACERARARWERFIAIRVEAREGIGMFPRLLPGATLIIDRHYNLPTPYRRRECTMFLIRKPDHSCVVRYIEKNANNILLRPHNHRYPIEIFVLPSPHPLSHYIVGRVAYVLMET